MRSKRFLLPVLLSLFVASVAPDVRASAVAQPPSDLLEWEVAVPASGGAATYLPFRDPGTNQPLTSASVLVVHDTASGSDIFVRLTGGGTATAPGTSTPTRTFRLKSTDGSINLDGRWSGISFISSDGTTPNIRIIVTF